MSKDSGAAQIDHYLASIEALLDMMGKSKPYRGTLTPEQIAAGMNAAGRNAIRLLQDAELLLEAKRYPSAIALAILAIEEAGKMPILRALSVAQDSDAIRQSWRDYRSHERKNVMWLMPLYVLAGVRSLQGLRRLFDPKSVHPRRLDELKQFATYTDCRDGRRWSEPPDVVDEDIARYIVRTARSLTKERATSTREIELWIEHVGPVLEPASTEGLKAFWSAMEAEGLNSHHIDDIDAFLAKPTG